MYQAIRYLMGNVTQQMGDTAIVYHNNESDAFNPSTGKTSGNTTQESVRALLGAFESYQVDGQVITRDDVKATIDAGQFDTEPQEDDELEDKLGNRYKVISVQKQLIEHEVVTYVLQLRQ